MPGVNVHNRLCCYYLAQFYGKGNSLWPKVTSPGEWGQSRIHVNSCVCVPTWWRSPQPPGRPLLLLQLRQVPLQGLEHLSHKGAPRPTVWGRGSPTSQAQHAQKPEGSLPVRETCLVGSLYHLYQGTRGTLPNLL